MNKQFFSMIVAVAICAAVLTSCDKVGISNMTPAEVQKEAVLAAIGKNSNLSEFAIMLKELDFSKIQADELTLFAVTNAGMSKSALNSTNDNEMNIKRSVVTGKYAKPALSDGNQLTALDGSTLKIAVVIPNRRVLVNGVELGEEIVAGNSVIYIVENTIPAEAFKVTFDSNGGSVVQSQTVKIGEKVEEPAAPTKEAATAGLYLGTPNAYSLDGWYYGNTLWDFDTPITKSIVLTARWMPPTSVSTPIDVSGQSGANNVAKAIAYVIANPAEYTLLIDENVNLAPQLIDISNVKLTIIGLGGVERKINLSSNGSLFSLGTWSSKLTGTSLAIGNDITLVGLANNNRFMVGVHDGAKFVMLDGSKITGNTTNHFASVVYLDNFSTFTMKGGTITGNANLSSWFGDGAVHINGPSNISVEGGSIIDNKNTSDIHVFNFYTHITLKGSATIGSLTFNYIPNYYSSYPSAVIGSDWTGNVGSLNLLNSDHLIDMNDHIAHCAGKQVVRAIAGYTLKDTDIAKITLGNFIYENAKRPISETYKIAGNGADIGKLVAKELSMKSMSQNVISLMPYEQSKTWCMRVSTDDFSPGEAPQIVRQLLQ